jgi:alanine racemase
MPASRHVDVRIDLDRVRQNVADVRARVGRAEVHAVVKADAYGLGARRVAEAIADVVDGFVVFHATEAVDAGLVGKPILSLGPPEIDVCLKHGIRPAVWTAEDAAALRAARPALSVDTGMQRFGCPPELVDRIMKAGECREAFTHATRVEAVHRLVELVGGRGLRLHAAGSALLDEPSAHLDLVRPGLALYRGAVTVRTQVIEAREGRGPAGYTGFVAPRHGVIRVGYSNGLRPGPCVVGGQRRRVLEVGMQTAFVELGLGDDVGAPVTLLGPADTSPARVREDEVAAGWRCTPHEALFHLSGAGVRSYLGS